MGGSTPNLTEETTQVQIDIKYIDVYRFIDKYKFIYKLIDRSIDIQIYRQIDLNIHRFIDRQMLIQIDL